MNRDELRVAWLEALRSGEYKQGTGVLCNLQNQYCCLGVLCEVAGVPKEEDKEEGAFTFDGERAALSQHLTEKVGLYDYLGISKDGNKCLSALNDHGVPFSEIADALETGDYWVE